MTVSFELPNEIEQTLRRELGDLDQAAKEAALVELYRQHQLTHHEVATALGISRFETDDLLKRHGVYYDITLDDIKRESASLRPGPDQ
jgi:predicted HTH domain antitoxin